jgi:hypothetical protein
MFCYIVYGFVFGAGALFAGAVSGPLGVGAAVNAALTEGGILSEFASKTLTSQICVSVKRPLKLGIPVNRMPFSAFQ